MHSVRRSSESGIVLWSNVWDPVVHRREPWQCTMGRDENECTVSRSNVESKGLSLARWVALRSMECLGCHVVPKPIMRQECKQGRDSRSLKMSYLSFLDILTYREESKGWSLNVTYTYPPLPRPLPLAIRTL